MIAPAAKPIAPYTAKLSDCGEFALIGKGYETEKLPVSTLPGFKGLYQNFVSQGQYREIYQRYLDAVQAAMDLVAKGQGGS